GVVRNSQKICFLAKRPVLNSKTNVVVATALAIAAKVTDPATELEVAQIEVQVTRDATAT
ncbi:uncharacterized protein METZ01_LOCUS468566, partial [marine metagenome]